YKLIVDEQLVTVCSPDFKRTHARALKEKALFQLPHLLCDRLFPDKFLGRSENQIATVAKFNDIATTRAACEAGVGWALLPAYALRTELEQGSLIQIDIPEQGRSRYGVWWVRRRATLQPSAKKLLKWLSGIEL
ncbi:MAG: substrate-binding domain-containing protein, partial [Bdellovibrionota bacterium]